MAHHRVAFFLRRARNELDIPQRSPKLLLTFRIVDLNVLDARCCTDRQGMNRMAAAVSSSLRRLDQSFTTPNLLLLNCYIRACCCTFRVQVRLDKLFACEDIVGDANPRLRKAQFGRNI